MLSSDTINYNSNNNHWIQITNNLYFDSDNRKEIKIFSKLFDLNKNINYYKIELNMNVEFHNNINLNGSTSTIFYVNQPPKNGNCSFNPKYGTIDTKFKFYCDNWSDEDGKIKNYVFFGKLISFFFYLFCFNSFNLNQNI